MNADELREFKEQLQAQAWENYSFLRHYIDRQKAELEAAGYDMPMHKLLKLMYLMKKSDDYIRIALGMPTTIKQNREVHKIQSSAQMVIIIDADKP